MKIVYFTHSLTSCWNHGNAHFLRGVLRELAALGHAVTAYEPADAWSRANLVRDHGAGGLAPFAAAYPELTSCAFGTDFDPGEALDGADLVIVHEWNDPALVAEIGRARRAGGRFLLLFHDTHHRAVSDPDAIRAFDLSDYDGVLAFGEALAEVYRRWGWGERVFVWHEAADTRLFRPPVEAETRNGVIFVGNWGDDERAEELERFLLRPVEELVLPLTVHGVRYPQNALDRLAALGARYAGWLPNPQVPAAFARHLVTVHVPRRFYVDTLPGIPTIRVFEALACGIPLVCAPWHDTEALFRPGEDYLVARTGDEMRRHLAAVAADPALRRVLVASGLDRIRARHTCAHRARELLAVVERLGGRASAPAERASTSLEQI